MIAVYVDDLIIAVDDSKYLEELKKKLMTIFKMKDMGYGKNISYCLGIKIKQDVKRGTIIMNYWKYVEEVLALFEMKNCKPSPTPMDGDSKLQKPNPENEPDSALPCQNLIGSLMYLSVSTRPDITYAVSALSQFNINYGQEHLIAAKRVLRYLQGTQRYGLTYKKTQKKLEGYADADWGGDLGDRRSYTGYVFLLAGASIS